MANSDTQEQAEHKKRQAVTLMERIGDSGRAEEFDDMSVEPGHARRPKESHRRASLFLRRSGVRPAVHRQIRSRYVRSLRTRHKRN